jgi:hypothetical protein
VSQQIMISPFIAVGLVHSHYRVAQAQAMRRDVRIHPFGDYDCQLSVLLVYLYGAHA